MSAAVANLSLAGSERHPEPDPTTRPPEARLPRFDDHELAALLDGSAPDETTPEVTSAAHTPAVSEQATQLTRQLAAQHLEVLAQAAADAVEGRRPKRDPRVERALGQTRRLASEMEDTVLIAHIDRLQTLFGRLAEAEAADHSLFARRLRDTVIALGTLAGGGAEARLRAICVRRRGLHPLAARLRALGGIGDRRLSRLWEAGLLSIESLIDADPSDLVTAAGITRALAVRVIRVAREHALQRANAVAELLEEAASEASDIASGQSLDEVARERLGGAADAARRLLERWAPPKPPPLPPEPPPLPIAAARVNTARQSCRVLARLGTGGEAEVVRAVYLGSARIERTVALKRLLPHLATNPMQRMRLVAEGRLLARLNHPHIVSLVDVVHVGDEPQLALELLPGCDLLRLLEAATLQRRRMSPELAVRVGLAMASALESIHALEIGGRPLMHGDIAPANVMLTHDGRVKLVDFGIAALQELAQPTIGIRGHAAYLAPELLAGNGRGSPASDQFALATTLWEAMTLRRLFFGGDEPSTFRNIAEGRIEERFARHPHVPEALLAILRKALARDPAARFASIADFTRALDGWLAATPPREPHDGLTRFLCELVPGPLESPIEPPPPPRAADA